MDRLKNKKIGIFIFRRDLRLIDNIGLLNLQNEVDVIIPIFILDKYQIKKSSHNAHYFSNNVVQFMAESLQNLNQYLQDLDSYLRLYYGNPYKIINKLIKQIKQDIESENIIVGFNADFSKYAKFRDKQIIDLCSKYQIKTIISHDDLSLIPINLLHKSDGNGFKQYGAFYKSAIKHKVNKPIKSLFKSYLNYKIKTKSEFDIDRLDAFYKTNYNLAQNGGRSIALSKLKNLEKFKDYNDKRDNLDYTTTNLSAYLNFGCISIREAYYYMRKILGPNTILLKQLYWRDFYLQALIYLPGGDKYKHMDKRYEQIKWSKSSKYWDKLINSETGI